MRTFVRSTLAFLAAVVAPAALMLGPSAAGLMFSAAAKSDPYAWIRLGRWAGLMLLTTSLYVVVLGLPAFLILKWRRAIRWWSTVLSGFVLGCIPMAVGTWPRVQTDMKTTASHWDGEKMVPTMIDGVPTPEAWVQFAEVVGVFGCFGAVSALAFWIVWRVLEPSAARH